MSRVLIPNPEERGNHVDFGSGLVSDVTRTESEVEILHKEQDIGDKIYPLAQTGIGGGFTGNGSDESRYLGSVGVPEKKEK